MPLYFKAVQIINRFFVHHHRIKLKSLWLSKFYCTSANTYEIFQLSTEYIIILYYIIIVY